MKLQESHDVIHALLRPDESTSWVPDSALKADASVVEFARCFLRLANLPNFALVASVVMKRPFGSRLAGCFTLSKPRIVANRRSERAGFPFKVHVHMLRHACGYALVNAGQKPDRRRPVNSEHYVPRACSSLTGECRAALRERQTSRKKTGRQLHENILSGRFGDCGWK